MMTSFINNAEHRPNPSGVTSESGKSISLPKDIVIGWLFVREIGDVITSP